MTIPLRSNWPPGTRTLADDLAERPVHRLLPPDAPERPNRWFGMATCQCVCGCGFVAASKAPDFGPALCSHCEELPHIHWHHHGLGRHSHEHVHPDEHAHSSRTDLGRHGE